MTSNRYSFGSTPTAAERLMFVAEVFDPTMAAALAVLPARQWRRVLDLGCGPGSSTARLCAHLHADEVVGLDASVEFVTAARARVPSARFEVADALDPLPGERPDLVYARFLLSHVPHPLAVVDRWATQLADDGFLVLEEPERIGTDDGIANAYLAITAGLVASRGADMFVGPTLAAHQHGRTTMNRAVEHRVPAPAAARMFAMNLATIRTDSWVRERWPDAELDRLAAALHERSAEPLDARPPLRWEIRQVVLGGTT